MRGLVLGLVLLLPAVGHAQAVDLRVPAPEADALASLRLSFEGERRTGGVALMTGGLASVVAGGVVAGFAHEDPFWLGFSIGTLGWGAVNAALAIGLFDVGGGRRARIEDDRALRGDALRDARDALLSEQHGAATLFAFNTGLDVFYVVAGALLFALADLLDDPYEADVLRGYSAAQISQGGFLLVFDLVEWVAAGGRADRVRSLRRW
ncbi:MAG: hypothetical protein AB8I08_27845 [Sandaracinaceae bacterium]